eukprot:c8834_g1_i2.p1 GENE.c8834_g1_i2~~c8834_g1_i2.p1  ORF type:complete len:240 (-),score=35.11 c8834_g1_i2:138-857(-)
MASAFPYVPRIDIVGVEAYCCEDKWVRGFDNNLGTCVGSSGGAGKHKCFCCHESSSDFGGKIYMANSCSGIRGALLPVLQASCAFNSAMCLLYCGSIFALYVHTQNSDMEAAAAASARRHHHSQSRSAVPRSTATPVTPTVPHSSAHPVAVTHSLSTSMPIVSQLAPRTPANETTATIAAALPIVKAVDVNVTGSFVVEVAAGSAGGQEMVVQDPSNVRYSVVIPNGLVAGDKFRVAYL